MTTHRYILYLILTTMVAVVGIAVAFRPVPTLLTTTPLTTVSSSTPSATPPAQTATPTKTPFSNTGIPVSLTVDEERFSAKVPEGSTVIDLMHALENEGLRFEGKEYASLGFFVESIHSKTSGGGFYWFLYVNGVSSKTGASQTTLKAGDRVEWIYKQSE